MKPLNIFTTLMTEDEMHSLLRCAMELLEDPGMRIESEKLRKALSLAGACVDESTQIVKYPVRLIEETISRAVSEESARRECCSGDTATAEGTITFSWHTPFMKTAPDFHVSLGGGCPLFYDYKTDSVRYSTEDDLIRMLHLAEGIPQIISAGNAVHCVIDKNGNNTPPQLMPILGAATIAKHSSKPGASALISPWQLEYLVAMGEVVRDGSDGYKSHPVFININDTMPPLQLSKPEGEVIEALAAKGFPVYILPMPLLGVSAPITVFASAATGIAEILGVWTGVKAINPDCPLECSVVSGAIEPRTGNPCFSAPEAIAVDLAVAQVFRSLGLRCGTGVGFIDACVPGTAAAYERTFKSTIAAMCGESNYPAGILAAGNIFSMEQLFIDLDIGAGQNHFMGLFDKNDLDNAVDLVRERGIGGFFMDTDHTVSNFREKVWVPQIFSRSKSKDPSEVPDMVNIAHERALQVIEQTNPYVLPEDKSREIDRIVDSAKSRMESL